MHGFGESAILNKSKNGLWLTCGESYAYTACVAQPHDLSREPTCPGLFGQAGVFYSYKMLTLPASNVSVPVVVVMRMRSRAPTSDFV